MQEQVFSHEYFMKQAIKQAELAFEKGEIPVGTVVVCDNQIIARAYNQTEVLNDVTAHAEILALTSASNFLGSKYLVNCNIYVTVEPCIMCAAAMFWAKINTLIYGTNNPGYGFTSIKNNILHPQTIVVSDILKDKCSELIHKFFVLKRK